MRCWLAWGSTRVPSKVPSSPSTALTGMRATILIEPTSMSTIEAPLSAAPELLRLLQLSSSLCPIGAFAFSQGLEHAVERGWVGNEAALGDWLLGVGRHAL